MNIAGKINLDNYLHSEIIDLHRAGIITLEEIIASGRIYNSFSDDLYNYVKSQELIQKLEMRDTVINTCTCAETQGTRMVTIKDRRKFVR